MCDLFRGAIRATLIREDLAAPSDWPASEGDYQEYLVERIDRNIHHAQRAPRREVPGLLDGLREQRRRDQDATSW